MLSPSLASFYSIATRVRLTTEDKHLYKGRTLQLPVPKSDRS